MSYKLWFVYFVLFMGASFIEFIGQGTYAIADPDDINRVAGFQVDEEASGGGFIGLPRIDLGFFLALIPKFVSWNFSYLQGDFQIIQYAMIFVFGGLLVLSLFERVMGLFQRNR